MTNRRYSVSATPHGCTLVLHGEYGADYETSEHTFWVPGDGGYIYETTHCPGTAGRQVCERLFGLGTCTRSSAENLPGVIRRLARRHCDRIDRERF